MIYQRFMKLVVQDIRGKLGTFQLLEWKKCNGKEGSDRWEQVLEEYFRIPGTTEQVVVTCSGLHENDRCNRLMTRVSATNGRT